MQNRTIVLNGVHCCIKRACGDNSPGMSTRRRPPRKPAPDVDAVLRYLRTFFRENRVLPSYQTIANDLGFSTKSLVKVRLDALVRDGYLEPLAVAGNRLGPSPKFFGARDAPKVVVSGSAAALEAVPAGALKELGLGLAGRGFRVFRVTTDDYIAANICAGHLLVVEENLSPKADDLVVLPAAGGRQFGVYRVLSRSRANTILVPLDRGAVEGPASGAAPTMYVVKAILRAP